MANPTPDTAALLNPLKLSIHYTLGVCTHATATPTGLQIGTITQSVCSNCGVTWCSNEPMPNPKPIIQYTP
jgi:hypothetical protein